jgi:agmatinase
MASWFTGYPTFLNVPRVDVADLEAADVAVIGVPYGVPYDMEGARSPASAAPRAIREQSQRLARYLTHYDYDFDGDIFAGRQVRIVDCGDVPMVPGRYDENQRTVTEAIRAILHRGAVPFVLGGDHSIPIPVMRAYDGCEPFCVVQIDAHLDWRDEINGVREGLSSPMRRASELPWVSGMVQIGIRGVGSARQVEVDAARAYGSVIVGAKELRRTGVAAARARSRCGALLHHLRCRWLGSRDCPRRQRPRIWWIELRRSNGFAARRRREGKDRRLRCCRGRAEPRS